MASTSSITTAATPKTVVPKSFLQNNGLVPTRERLDFNALGIPAYSKCWAVVIDNAFTAEECAQLVSLAENHAAPGGWERAMINVGNYEQMLAPETRNCDRIIWDSPDIVSRIWDRISYLVPEIQRIENQASITGIGPVKRKEIAILTRLNERMRFLRYGPGEYFREHCDGQFRTKDGSEFSLYTVHLYLNESTEDEKMVGGSTSFFSPYGSKTQKEVHVRPKMGRVLLFQHRDMIHSGEEVLEGMKLTMRTDIMFKNEKKDG